MNHHDMMATARVKILPPKAILIFLLLGIVFCVADVSLRLDKEGAFKYGNFLKRINGSVLLKQDALLSQLEVDNDIECASLCVTNALCLSMNFGVDSANTTDKTHCELLSWGGTDYRNYLIKKTGFFHMRMQVWK
jgi:hypothetical protein